MTVAATDNDDPVVVLGFFAHPDDETLSAGSLLAVLSRHAHVHVITATRGEMGEQMGPMATRASADPQSLAMAREQEVKHACHHLGVASHTFLDGGTGRYVDSGMVWQDEQRVVALPDPQASPNAFSVIDPDEPARELARYIEELRPTVVLTEEAAGGYGHPDHIRCHEVMMRAVHMAAPRWRVPFVAFPVWEERRWRLATAELADYPNLPLVDEYGEALNLPDLQAPLRSGVREHPDLVLDIDTSTVLPQVLAAMRAHKTQVHQVTQVSGQHLGGWFALTNNDYKPIPTHAALMLEPGWGEVEGLHNLFKGFARSKKPQTSGVSRFFWYQPFLYAFALFTGVIVGFVGTFSHRTNPPWGLVVGLLAVLAGAVFNRSIGSMKTTLTYGLAALASVALILIFQRGGDVIVAEDAVGLAWIIGVNVIVGLYLLVQLRRKTQRKESS